MFGVHRIEEYMGSPESCVWCEIMGSMRSVWCVWGGSRI